MCVLSQLVIFEFSDVSQKFVNGDFVFVKQFTGIPNENTLLILPLPLSLQNTAGGQVAYFQPACHFKLLDEVHKIEKIGISRNSSSVYSLDCTCGTSFELPYRNRLSAFLKVKAKTKRNEYFVFIMCVAISLLIYVNKTLMASFRRVTIGTIEFVKVI